MDVEICVPSKGKKRAMTMLGLREKWGQGDGVAKRLFAPTERWDVIMGVETGWLRTCATGTFL